MFNMMRNNWFKPKTAYIQVVKDCFRIYCSDSQQLFSVEGKFSHPRMLLGDFVQAERALQQQIKQQSIFSGTAQYRVIIHPKELLDGGLSYIEQRAFTELFSSLGFREVRLWLGHDLSSEQIDQFDWKARN